MYWAAAVPEAAPRGSLLTRAARRDLYQDDVNEAVFMRPGQYLTRSLVFVDERGVDGAVSGLAALVGGLAGRLRRWQTGYVRSYAMSMLAGVIVVVRRHARRPDLRTESCRLPWLTTIGLIPLAGRRRHLDLAVAALEQRRLGAHRRAGDVPADPRRDRGDGLPVRRLQGPDVPVLRDSALDPAVRRELRPRRRRHRAGPGRAVRRPRPGVRPRRLERGRGHPGRELLRAGAGAGDVHGRRVRRPRRVPVLRVLRGHAHPGLLPDRLVRRARSAATRR